MRYLSLFSGIEAASCAWRPLGWELKGVCEIEKFPCNVLKHHYPDVPNIGIYQTDKSATLQTADPTPACQQGGIAVCSQARVRKLTPTECLRLQGFPDDWFEGVDGYSDTAAYKAIGNSMCVNVMHWLGKRIDTVEKELQNGIQNNS